MLACIGGENGLGTSTPTFAQIVSRTEANIPVLPRDLETRAISPS